MEKNVIAFFCKAKTKSRVTHIMKHFPILPQYCCNIFLFMYGEVVKTIFKHTINNFQKISFNVELVYP